MGLLLVGTTAGCHRPAPPGDTSLQIAIERRPCFGGCPVYRLTVLGNGDLTYEGIRFVAREGTVNDRIAADLVTKLAAEFKAVRFDTLADRYVDGEPTCPMHTEDAPTVITSITSPGLTKRVQHDQGCTGVPTLLTRIENRIDEVVESWRWTTGRKP